MNSSQEQSMVIQFCPKIIIGAPEEDDGNPFRYQAR